MTNLCSKVQHKNFEIGEFNNSKERTYDETIELIENFHWEEERKNLAVSLTNPSITIEGKNEDFLKLALFYNGKFVLHYFNQAQALFTKSFTNIKDCFPYIKNFFEQEDFDTTNFKKENTWMQHNLQHFVSQDFNYTVNKESIRRFLISTSGINFAFSIILIGMFLFTHGHRELPVLIFLFVTMFIVGGGLNLILFFNFYTHVKNKILIMSKGNEVFYYGNIDNSVKYYKSEIAQIIVIRINASRNPINGFALVVIELKDGQRLQIPNLLVDYMAMEEKLTGIAKIEENRVPFIKD